MFLSLFKFNEKSKSALEVCLRSTSSMPQAHLKHTFYFLIDFKEKYIFLKMYWGVLEVYLKYTSNTPFISHWIWSKIIFLNICWGVCEVCLKSTSSTFFNFSLKWSKIIKEKYVCWDVLEVDLKHTFNFLIDVKANFCLNGCIEVCLRWCYLKHTSSSFWIFSLNLKCSQIDKIKK